MGLNEPIALTDFGVYVNECSKFCKDKDGLELWLNLVTECKTNFMMLNNEIYPTYFNEYDVGIIVSMFALMMFCVGWKWL
jgi:hypothetical protein